MKANELKVGKVYLLKGGLVLRYHGFWGTENEELRDGYCGAFQQPSNSISTPAVGYSAAVEDVLQEITQGDLNWLRHRKEEARVRKLTGDVQEMIYVIEELTGESEPEHTI